MSEFAHEIVAEHLGIDTKVGRTVMMLVRHPGRITKEFFEGKRIRYVPPLRLYISLSVLFFVLSALSSSFGASSTTRPAGGPNIRVNTGDAQTDSMISATIQRGRAEKSAGGASAKDMSSPLALDTLRGNAVSRYFKRRIMRRIAYFRANGTEASAQISESFMHHLPDALFLLVPVIAALLGALYYGQHRYFAEHLVFVLHFQAFAFAAMIVSLLPIPQLDEHSHDLDHRVRLSRAA